VPTHTINTPFLCAPAVRRRNLAERCGYCVARYGGLYVESATLLRKRVAGAW
jgi:hypothetical protein